MEVREADAIVVGTGAGGGTIARELTRQGKKVIMLEKGAYHRKFFGSHMAPAMIADRMSLTYSDEYLQVVRGISVGGSTMMTCGAAANPAPWIKKELGIDLTGELAEARQELGVGKLPDSLVGKSSLRMIEAADKLGYSWEIFDKLIDPEKCKEGCYRCMMVCPRDAKWTSRRFVDEAVSLGAVLMPKAPVKRVLHSNGVVRGVEALVDGLLTEFTAPLVVLSAGGMGSAPLLLEAGIEKAGKGLFVDPLVVTYGKYTGPGEQVGSAFCPPMTVGTWEFYESEGFMLSPLIEPMLAFGAHLALKRPWYAAKMAQFKRTFGIMTKIRDDLAGELRQNGSFSKPLSDSDKHKLNRGDEVSREILVEAGCEAKSLATTPMLGAHPGGGCRIGEAVDRDLETDIRGLFVCDASVFPKSLGTPVVLVTACMAKRLARHLLGQAKPVGQGAAAPDGAYPSAEEKSEAGSGMQAADGL